MKKLAIITTHPIQYNAPWFRLLAQRPNIEIKVFYTWSQAETSVLDHSFRKEITWDIPLLEGYTYEFVENISKKPGSHHFFGIDCPTLISRVEEFTPDAVLFFGWNFKSYVLALRHFKGKVPVWFRGDSTLLNESGGYKTLIRRTVLKKIYTYIDKAFYVGEANKNYFIKHGLTEKQLVYVSHAIDNERFGKGEQESYQIRIGEWRKELNYSEDAIVILFAGKFESIKQPKLLIEAVQKSNLKRIKPLQLLMVGNGPLENDLKKLAINDSNIRFLPFQNQTQMPLVYRLASVLCLPSRSETWGLSVNEAMACRKPVIVTNRVGCTVDLVRNGQNGYDFIYNDLNQLVRILNSLSLLKLNELGQQAFKDIQKYNFATIVSAIENELFNLKNKNQTK